MLFIQQHIPSKLCALHTVPSSVLITTLMRCSMSDYWFTSKLDPEIENHPEEVLALEHCLRQDSTVTEAAQTITPPVITSTSPKDGLGCLGCLHGLLHDALLELPACTEPLVFLLQAIESLPEPNSTATEPTERPVEKL